MINIDSYVYLICLYICILCFKKKENLPKIFNEIVQFNVNELQNGGGSGLGLWSEYSIIS